MFTRYESGAEVDIEVVKRYENGAEIDVGGVYKYVNGAEEDVWCSIKRLDLTKTITTGYMRSQNEWGDTTCLRASNGFGCYNQFTTSGTFVNPTISFDYESYLSYLTANGLTYGIAGTLYAVYISEGSYYTQTVEIVPLVNTYDSGIQHLSYDFPEGTYKQIGFRFNWMNHPWGDEYYPLCIFEISNILIDDQKYITDPADDYDYGDA